MSKYDDMQLAFKLRDEIPKIQKEIQDAETKLPKLKVDLKSKLEKLSELIKKKTGSTGDLLMDYIVVNYSSFNTEFHTILENIARKLKGKKNELFLVVFADAGLECFLGTIFNESLLFTCDCSTLAFPILKFAYWSPKKKISVHDKGSLSSETHKNFDWKIQDLSSKLKDGKTPIMRIFVGDGEVWQFLKETDQETRTKFREALKGLEIDDTYTW